MFASQFNLIPRVLLLILLAGPVLLDQAAADSGSDAETKVTNPFGPAGFEFDWMSKFRTVSAILDILYIAFMSFPKKKYNRQYPSPRFAEQKHRVLTHIISGAICILSGTVIHFYNEAYGISAKEDQGHLWQGLYFAFGVTGIVQALTCFTLTPKVMGEKRITIPLYFAAGGINLINAVVLLREPNLRNAFLLWGSINTFIYVRAYVFLLSFAHIDWELLYTYAIVAAGATTYPLSVQHVHAYFHFLAPLLYAPFHERFCRWFPWLGLTDEDWANGNMPSRKNIAKSTKMVRTFAVDDEYVQKLSDMVASKDIESPPATMIVDLTAERSSESMVEIEC